MLEEKSKGAYDELNEVKIEITIFNNIVY